MNKQKIIEWKLVSHSHQIADTGDYDGCYEITDGKISIFTKDDDDEALEPIVKALNDSGCKFYLDDVTEFELRLEKEKTRQLEQELSSLKAEADWCDLCGEKHNGKCSDHAKEILKAEAEKQVDLNCEVCGKDFRGDPPKMCCSGRECGCMGQPIEPIVCSNECYDKLVNKAEAEKEVSDVQDYFDLIYDNIPVNIDNCILPDYVREELANILNASIRDNLIKKG